MRKMFSKNQIKELTREVLATDDPVVLNGDLEARGDVEVNGDLEVGGSLSQAQPNESFYYEYTDADFPTGISVANLYNRFEVINNVLYIVGNFIFENTTGSAISVGTINKDITIPDSIGDKIYDYGGKKVSEVPTSLTDVCSTLGLTGIENVVGAVNKTVYVRHPSQHTLRIAIPLSISVNANSKNAFTWRIFITLL